MSAPFPDYGEGLADASRALWLAAAAASPLWFYYAGAASMGVAWWWLTRLAPVVDPQPTAAAAPPAPACKTGDVVTLRAANDQLAAASVLH